MVGAGGRRKPDGIAGAVRPGHVGHGIGAFEAVIGRGTPIRGGSAGHPCILSQLPDNRFPGAVARRFAVCRPAGADRMVVGLDDDDENDDS
ncbi:hypothetical protein [Actinopolymorpha pittospori]|uniref:Uncharacterized protein n=1 Tax=Actinopolymorpha pittospori TaxID=648752 RepID=A0A927N105_9ACTN|nr:hypothetical protein [Actinopolymorpha pittospori]MBE1610301.1 hypothetical protein [Actinopolymorpha pittospori]